MVNPYWFLITNEEMENLKSSIWRDITGFDAVLSWIYCLILCFFFLILNSFIRWFFDSWFRNSSLEDFMMSYYLDCTYIFGRGWSKARICNAFER